MKANKDVLIARSSYFSSMLKDDNNYVESQSGVINLNYVKKAVMQGIICYLFTGQIDFKTFTIEQLVEMMTHTRMMSIDRLFLGIEKYLRSHLEYQEMALELLLKGFALAQRFNLDCMMKPFVKAIHKQLDNGKSCDKIESFTVDMIKTLFLTVTDNDKAQTDASSQRSRLRRFAVWHYRNPELMKDEDKRKILETFDLTKFIEDELCWIRRRGLYTHAEIDGSFVAIIKRLRDEKKELQDWLTELEKKLYDKPSGLKSEMLQRISRLKKEVADRRNSLA